MEAHDYTDVIVALLVLTHYFFVIGFHQEGQHHTVSTQGGFDDVGDIMFVLGLVEVGHVLARGVLMLGQVVVGTVGHAP